MPTTAADQPHPPPEQPIEAHDELSRRLLEHAEAMIAEGDRLQASEKMWGAVAHKVKAIAAERGWPNRSHADTRAIVHHIAAQPGNRKISHLFRGVAEDAHRNFYDDTALIEDLAEDLAEIRELLNLLDAVRSGLGSVGLPTDRRYRERYDRRASANP